MRLTCDYCGNDITKKPAYIKRFTHHFCDRHCYTKFRRDHLELYSHNTPNDMSHYQKLVKFAEIRRIHHEGVE